MFIFLPPASLLLKLRKDRAIHGDPAISFWRSELRAPDGITNPGSG
jgi:hypothetical protein